MIALSKRILIIHETDIEPHSKQGLFTLQSVDLSTLHMNNQVKSNDSLLEIITSMCALVAACVLLLTRRYAEGIRGIAR